MAKPVEILLVEDSPTDAELMTVMLSDIEDFPNNVSLAKSLSNARAVLEQRAFDAIVLDLNLPDSNGLTTYQAVHAVAPQTPIVILTGMEDREVLSNVLQSGADNYLIKDKVDGGRVAIAILASIRKRL